MTAAEIDVLLDGVVPAVKQHLAETLAPLLVRVAALETRAMVPGPAGEKGEPGIAGERGEKVSTARSARRATRAIRES